MPVYPRPRGGAEDPPNERSPGRGLSPPTRGSRPPQGRKRQPCRSIPAHAGEPTLSPVYSLWLGVYPRPRGGARRGAPLAGRKTGLSPPTRGSLRRTPTPTSGARSIPAHAGEPSWRWTAVPVSRVYPRPRGGAGVALFTNVGICGLSPPTRGTLDVIDLWDAPDGSIPAHAGDPVLQCSRSPP